MDIADTNSTKEKIIELLSYNWPLSLRKIYYLLKKEGITITYQAVHKAIHQLLEDNKLKKTDEGYIINLIWIKGIHDKTEIIRVNYFSKKRSFLTTGNTGKEEIQTFIFTTWFDLEKYLYYLQKKTLKSSIDKRSICVHHHHEWRPLFYLRAEYNWIVKLQSLGYDMYTICAGKTILDKWSKKFYESLGNKLLMGISLNGPSELIVFSDLVIEVYIPFEILEKFDNYLKKIKSIEELDHTWLIKNIFEKEIEIKVVVHKDKTLSDEVRKHIMSHFK